MNIQTNTNIDNIVTSIRLFAKPAIVFCNNEHTNVIAKSCINSQEQSLQETNTGHRIIEYPDKEIVKVVRKSDIDRIVDVDKYSTVIHI
jgi:hypothetical protein